MEGEGRSDCFVYWELKWSATQTLKQSTLIPDVLVTISLIGQPKYIHSSHGWPSQDLRQKLSGSYIVESRQSILLNRSLLHPDVQGQFQYAFFIYLRPVLCIKRPPRGGFTPNDCCSFILFCVFAVKIQTACSSCKTQVR